MSGFKPLLSPPQNPMDYPKFFQELEYPIWLSPKFDGIRGLVKPTTPNMPGREQTVFSRSGEKIPSIQVQQEFGKFDLAHFDGELIEGSPYDDDVYNRTQSYVMSKDKTGDLHFYVFDHTHPDHLDDPYHERYERLQLLVPQHPKIHLVEQIEVWDEEQLLEKEGEFLELGYEGAMGRSPVGRYKNGRGTWKEKIIFKLKRFADDEGLLVGLKPRMQNMNEQTRDELGYAKRSDAKEGKVALDMVGMFQVIFKEEIIDVAPGKFNHEQLKEIWANKEQYIGRKYVKFRHFPHGAKDKPRFPKAIGFRDKIDM